VDSTKATIINPVVLDQDREILVVLKPATGYGAQMEFRNGRFQGLRLTDLDSGEVTEIDRFLFLSLQHYMLSTERLSEALNHA
jgi:hypothetical protein